MPGRAENSTGRDATPPLRAGPPGLDFRVTPVWIPFLPRHFDRAFPTRVLAQGSFWRYFCPSDLLHCMLRQLSGFDTESPIIKLHFQSVLWCGWPFPLAQGMSAKGFSFSKTFPRFLSFVTVMTAPKFVKSHTAFFYQMSTL